MVTVQVVDGDIRAVCCALAVGLALALQLVLSQRGVCGDPVQPRRPLCTCCHSEVALRLCKGREGSGPASAGAVFPRVWLPWGRAMGKQGGPRGKAGLEEDLEWGLGGQAATLNPQVSLGCGHTTSTPMDVSVPDMA